ncbi:carboxylesterase/lipase family protein [Microbacterium trichothecenolyticum]|uniref:Carboxylic ester hydrolase n=1 Tax=Microbacterium trichothecenolyticum TaxID=69370 RepID=A0ABU0TYF7_MICTR|nr:carboxylesterase/lipase family protein [Microbacterium trichothecenolyticum]MDQ1124693.1 para-nitrobenzyl esterase [Microbacterium trichothecenolyticum]
MHTASSGPLAEAPAGRFRGRVVNGARRWLGIRYAQPPLGPLRWRAPLPAPDAGLEVGADAFGAACPQPPSPLPLGDGVMQDEDCLSVNVWSPDATSSAPRPVMVWLHGGAYVFGAASQRTYEGASLATTGDVVVVTLNYRLGALGFLDLRDVLTRAEGNGDVDGNLALRDVLLALRWVQRNIAAFGGDPANVTVFGESAGGGLVTTLMATPSASGLFHRAIAQSSPASSVYGRERAAEVAARFVELAGVDPVSPTAGEQLRAADVETLLAAAQRLFAEVPAHAPGTLAFAPVVDGELVPEAPITVLSEGRGLPVPLMIGTNKDEASLFAYMKSPLIPITGDRLQRMFADMAAENPDVVLPERAQVLAAYENVHQRALGLGIAGDIGFRLPTLWVAEGHRAIAPVHLYRFDHSTPFLRLVRLGATHGSELIYLWGNLHAGPKDLTFRLGGRRTAETLSRRMQHRWSAFAHGLQPDAPDGPGWPAYRADVRATLVIDSRDRVVDDLDADLRRAWGDEVLTFR